MNIHLGQAILKRLKETGMSKSEFGRRINKSSSTVHDILSRKSIDTDLLWDISKVLEHNFFLLYTKSSQLGNPANEILNQKVDKLTRENQLLKKHLKDKDRIIALHEKQSVKKKK